jgi:hypothetical protein
MGARQGQKIKAQLRDKSLVVELSQIIALRAYMAFKPFFLTDLPRAIKNMTLLPAA